MGKGGEVRERFFVPIFTFTADVCKIKFSTILIYYIIKVFIPMYKHTSLCMFFWLVEHALLVMQ